MTQDLIKLTEGTAAQLAQHLERKEIGVASDKNLKPYIGHGNNQATGLVTDEELTQHLAQNVASEEGVHGIRYFKEELEVRNENGDWVIIPTGAANNVYFYNRGNEFPTVTGGWEVGWSPGDGNLTKYPTYLEVVTNKSGSARQYVTVNSIDLTDFGKLYIEWEGIGLGAHALDVVSSPEIIPGIASLTIMNESFTKTVSVLDISAVNGSYIIAVTQAANYDNIGSLKVYNVWGELK